MEINFQNFEEKREKAKDSARKNPELACILFTLVSIAFCFICYKMGEGVEEFMYLFGAFAVIGAITSEELIKMKRRKNQKEELEKNAPTIPQDFGFPLKSPTNRIHYEETKNLHDVVKLQKWTGYASNFPFCIQYSSGTLHLYLGGRGMDLEKLAHRVFYWSHKLPNVDPQMDSYHVINENSMKGYINPFIEFTV